MLLSTLHRLRCLDRETIRALATLELKGAVGGDKALLEPSFTCR